MSTIGNNRELAAILFSDISGFSNTMSVDEKLAMDQVSRHKEILSQVIQDYNGHLIKDMGDGQFVKFSSAVESVQCAILIQELAQAEDLSIRIGIHLGDVITKDNDVFGSGVNIASRIHTTSTPGSICISKEIWLQVKNQTDIKSKSLGAKEFKGIDEEVEVFELLTGDMSSKDGDNIKQDYYVYTKKIFLPVTGLLLAIIGGIFWVVYSFFDVGFTNSSFSTSVAVLDLKNINLESNSSFAEGMTEELISQLTRIQNLKVTPRTDIARYKNNQKIGTKEIAKELNVDYIVEGNVRISGNDLRVTATLISTLDHKTIWSDTYNENLLNVFFLVQDTIARQIVSELNRRIMKSPLLAGQMYGFYPKSRKLTKSRDAAEYTSMAYKELQNNKYSKIDNAKYALTFLANAVQNDSTYGEAYALMALANLLLIAGIKDAQIIEEKLKEVKTYINIALKYDPDNKLALAEKIELDPINYIKSKFIYNTIVVKLLKKMG